MYSFNNPLWDFCINCLGLEHTGCYGFEGDENANTHILWEDFPDTIREHFGRLKGDKIKLAGGLLNNREVIEVFKNDIFRRIDRNCLSRWLLNTITNEKFDLSIVFDAEYESDITLFTEVGGKTIHLLKAGKKDPISHIQQLPLGEFSCVIDNSSMTAEEVFAKIKPIITAWFFERGLI